MVGQSLCGDSVPVEPHQLICAGELQLKLIVPSTRLCPCLSRRSTTARFDQLVAEVVGCSRAARPQWTDHNASDPGITLLELGAWLGEQNIYRFDRLFDEAMRAFVRLVGIEPRPPGVARTVVAVESPAGTSFDFLPRVQLGSAEQRRLRDDRRVVRVAGRLARVAGRGRGVDGRERSPWRSE